MNYIEKLKCASNFNEALAVVDKALILELLDALPDLSCSHIIAHAFLEERGRPAARETVRGLLAELETEGLVQCRDVGGEGWPIIIATLRAPLADIPDAHSCH